MRVFLKNIKPLIILILVLVFVSFSPVKERKELKAISAKKLYKNIVDNYLNYNILTMKASMELKMKEKKFSLKANVKIKKDSLIWINLSHSTGIPVARILLTNDSIKILDKIHKTYYKGDYNSLVKDFKINFSFSSLQGIFTNELISFSSTKKHGKLFEDYKSSNDSVSYILQNFNNRIIKKQKKKNNEFFLMETIIISPDSFKIKKFSVEDVLLDRTLEISYKNFKDLKEYSGNDTLISGSDYFPQNIIFSLKVDSNETDFSLKYSKIKINTETKFNFKIPDSYSVKEL